MRDHGGNLDWARQTYGGQEWIDLSTGINPVPYPVPPLDMADWAALPLRSAWDALVLAAARAYGCAADALVPLAGAQGAIQLVPRLRAPGIARVLEPTYNEHAASLRAQGWQVEAVRRLDDLAGADLAVVVNPNNPDGQTHAPKALRALATRVGMLVVDESFADPTPGLSLAPDPGDRTVVLRSFGKFYGLAGVRLGFAIAAPAMAARLAELAGPWAVSGPALRIGAQALSDADWAAQTTTRLKQDAARLDALAQAAGWRLVGGTVLFRTYATADAARAQDHLARHGLWTRRFPYDAHWLRLGLPPAHGWDRLAEALKKSI